MLLSDDIPGSVNAHETPIFTSAKILHILVLDFATALCVSVADCH